MRITVDYGDTVDYGGITGLRDYGDTILNPQTLLTVVRHAFRLRPTRQAPPE